MLIKKNHVDRDRVWVRDRRVKNNYITPQTRIKFLSYLVHLEVVIEYSMSSTTMETEIKEINSDYRTIELE